MNKSKSNLLYSFLLVIMLGIGLFNQKEITAENNQNNHLIVQGSALLSVSPVYMPVISRTNAVLIDCLIRYESSGREDAVGDNGKAYGPLQFWESTFNQYKKKYNMEWLEYTSAHDQKVLADRMLTDGLDYHWTTIKFCK